MRADYVMDRARTHDHGARWVPTYLGMRDD